MWLPHQNRSESKIRVGGTAVLTIDYGVYPIALHGQNAVSANGSHPAPTATSF